MKFIDIHTHQKSETKSVLAIQNIFPKDFSPNFDFYFSCGIHTWFIDEMELSESLRIVELAIQEKNCLAIGEIGLDKLAETDFEKQQEVLEKQLLLSEKYQKPVIFHCVKAFSELIVLKNQLQPTVPWIIHGFNRKAQLAEQLQNHGFYLSFGADLLTKIHVQEAFKTIQLNQVFLETDDKTVEISTIYAKSAEIRGILMDELRERIWENFQKCFY